MLEFLNRLDVRTIETVLPFDRFLETRSIPFYLFQGGLFVYNYPVIEKLFWTRVKFILCGNNGENRNPSPFVSRDKLAWDGSDVPGTRGH